MPKLAKRTVKCNEAADHNCFSELRKTKIEVGGSHTWAEAIGN
jgi:hypothetical protein